MSTILNTLITDLQGGSIMSFAAWSFLGGLIGLNGSKIVNKTGHGVVRDVLLGYFRRDLRRFSRQSARRQSDGGFGSLQLTRGSGWRVRDHLPRDVTPRTHSMGGNSH